MHKSQYYCSRHVNIATFHHDRSQSQRKIMDAISWRSPSLSWDVIILLMKNTRRKCFWKVGCSDSFLTLLYVILLMLDSLCGGQT